MDLPKSSIVTIFLMIFALSAAIYRCWDALFRKFGERGKVYHAWTLTLLVVTHAAIGLFSLTEYFVVVKTYNVMVGGISFFGFLLGQLLRNWALVSLGELHSQQIEIKLNHRLVKKGPYIFFQHPYYLGAILEAICIPLIFNAYFSFCIAVATYVPAIFIRAALEDKVLDQYFNANRR